MFAEVAEVKESADTTGEAEMVKIANQIIEQAAVADSTRAKTSVAELDEPQKVNAAKLRAICSLYSPNSSALSALRMLIAGSGQLGWRPGPDRVTPSPPPSADAGETAMCLLMNVPFRRFYTLHRLGSETRMEACVLGSLST
eukprot:1691266-Pleurochrysis_carterae.AAC.1